MRSAVALGVVSGVLALAVVGCSSGDPGTGDPGPSPVGGSPSSSTLGDAASAKEDGSGPATTSGSNGTEPLPAYTVAVDVSVERLDLADRIEVTIDPDVLDEIDPFVRFGSCSGLRASVGVFTVTVVDASAPVQSISVVTLDRVTDAGVYDADVRVEPAGEEPVSALGTVTLDQDLRSGSFQAVEPTGEIVSGSFVCDGPPGIPMPIPDDSADAGDDGVVRAVEVVALLRRGEEERIVGLTLDTTEVAAADAECPGAVGADGPMLVRVEGGPAVGAITTFELTAEPPTIRMDVGGVSYEVGDVVLDVDDRRATGTFSGVTADGIAVDGAFRCS